MIGIDTNVILNVLRTDDPFLHKTGSIEFFKISRQRKISLAISVITLTEVFRKPFKDHSVEEKQNVDSFLHFIGAQTIQINNDSAIEAARLIGELNVSFADALIAASMTFAGVRTFVTRNMEDYKRTDLEIITPEEFIKKYC